MKSWTGSKPSAFGGRLRARLVFDPGTAAPYAHDGTFPRVAKQGAPRRSPDLSVRRDLPLLADQVSKCSAVPRRRPRRVDNGVQRHTRQCSVVPGRSHGSDAAGRAEAAEAAFLGIPGRIPSSLGIPDASQWGQPSLWAGTSLAQPARLTERSLLSLK